MVYFADQRIATSLISLGERCGEWRTKAYRPNQPKQVCAKHYSMHYRMAWCHWKGRKGTVSAEQCNCCPADKARPTKHTPAADNVSLVSQYKKWNMKTLLIVYSVPESYNNISLQNFIISTHKYPDFLSFIQLLDLQLSDSNFRRTVSMKVKCICWLCSPLVGSDLSLLLCSSCLGCRFDLTEPHTVVTRISATLK